MKVSWINIGVLVNIICIGLYIFVSKTESWGIFFNVVSLSLNVFLCLCILRVAKYGATNKELSGIVFLCFYKSLCIAYLLYGFIFGKLGEMFENISFIVFIALAGGLAWFVSKPIYGKLYEK